MRSAPLGTPRRKPVSLQRLPQRRLALEQLEGDLGEPVAAGQLSGVRGIGETLRDKITTLVTTGSMPFYDDLRKKTPPGLLEMLRVGGLGPKKVKAPYDLLGVDDLDNGRLRGSAAGLKGRCEDTTKDPRRRRIPEEDGRPCWHRPGRGRRAGLARRPPRRSRRPAHRSVRQARAGRKETIKDIDLLVSADDAKPVMDRFVGLPGVVQLLGRGDTKASVTVGTGTDGDRVVMQADLRVVNEAQFPFALNYFTGSKEHNIEMRRLALRGLKPQ